MKVKKAAHIFTNIIFYLLLIFMIFVSFKVVNATRKGQQPEVFGYKFYVVLTGSMQPEIDPGDLVVVKKINPESITAGDIITFKNENSDNVTTHRVKEVADSNENVSFITQGDANNIQDENPVKGEFVQGKVTKVVPKIGRTLDYMKNNIVVLLIFIIAVFVLIIAMLSIINALKKKEKRDVKNNS